jgi:hypothetical protein
MTIKNGFAQGWWETHSEDFKGLVGVSQDGWLYDAILDGANLWTHYILLYRGSSADGVMAADAMLDTYANTSLREIFGPWKAPSGD